MKKSVIIIIFLVFFNIYVLDKRNLLGPILERTYIKDLCTDIWKIISKVVDAGKCDAPKPEKKQRKQVSFSPSLDIISDAWGSTDIKSNNTDSIIYDLSDGPISIERPISTLHPAVDIPRGLDNPNWEDKDIGTIHDSLSFDQNY